MGEYIRLPTRQNDGKPVYKQQGDIGHMWWEASTSAWFVGAEQHIGEGRCAMVVRDSVAYPELITGTWLASAGDGNWVECSATVRETGACACVP